MMIDILNYKNPILVKDLNLHLITVSVVLDMCVWLGFNVLFIITFLYFVKI